MADTNPFDDLAPWNRIRLGGMLFDELRLVEIDGVSTKDEWKEQKSKESSGKVYVFAGTTVDKPKLTLEACDRAAFVELRRIWDLLKPVPGQGGTVPAAKTPSQTFAIGSPAAPGSSGSTAPTGQGGVFTVPSGSTSTGSSSSSSSTDNPGPRPPTIRVENEILKWHGITAIARGQWDGPRPTPTNSWRVVLTVVPQQPPTPAGAGAMAPPSPGSQFAIGSPAGANGSGATPQDAIAKDAAQGAAGT